MKPLLSICIAAYNVEEYIEECLYSVINQDFQDFEICLVDNGSSDRTVEICEDFERRFSNNIRLVKLPPPTQLGRASLTAARMCRGKYLVALDSDDYLKPGALKKIAEVAVTKNTDIIMYNYECITSDSNKTNFRMDFNPKMINDVAFLDAIKYITSYKTFQPLMWMYASKLDERTINAINNLKTGGQVHSDASRIIDFLLRYQSITYIDENIYVYRLRSSSVTASVKTSESSKGFFYAFIDLVEYINGRNHSYRSRYSIQENLIVALPNLLKYFKLALSGTRYLEREDYIAICNDIESIKDDLKILHSAKDDELSRFVDYIINFGSKEGLTKFIQYEEKRLIDKVKPYRDLSLYLMPTGSYSEHTAFMLCKNDIVISGFLDNSNLKHNQSIDGIICKKPTECLNFKVANEAVVLISSIYDAHIQEMKAQLITLGIKESNIIIRGEQ